MKRRWALVAFLLVAVFVVADQKKAAEKLRDAERAYGAGNIARAERSVRDALKEDPDSLDAHSLLGDILMATGRHSQAATEYTAALKADDFQKKLDPAQRNNLVNQQGAAYGLGGFLDRAKEIFEQAIQRDGQYPLFHYNLGAVYAEKKQLEPALESLRKAWSLRDKMPPGQPFPDPRKDPSFAAYLNDRRFQEAVRDMVF